MRALAAFVLTAGCLQAQVCATCHREIYESWRRTGMGRSFSRITSTDVRDATFDHAPSDQHFTIYRRDGRYYQRRVQTGPDGRETNAIEMSIDFVLGAGNHARTYLHRTDGGRLVELPLAWYSENGGTFAMNPGYEGPDHMDFRRKLDEECLFCHTAYPGSARAAPEAIDCGRCHGSGDAHVKTGGAILNPAHLPPGRQLEICLQ